MSKYQQMCLSRYTCSLNYMLLAVTERVKQGKRLEGGSITVLRKIVNILLKNTREEAR
jgi:hypothetical protein